MNLHDAHTLAIALVQQHGLHDWRFAFDRARQRFGACHTQRKLITLSRWLTQLNDQEQVRETILHEIAHALAPGDGHGARWRAACAAVGAKPQRCYRAEEVVAPPRPPARYLLGCRTCNWWADRRRITRARLICKRCRGEVIYRHKATGADYIVTQNGRAWSLRRVLPGPQVLQG